MDEQERRLEAARLAAKNSAPGTPIAAVLADADAVDAWITGGGLAGRLDSIDTRLGALMSEEAAAEAAIATIEDGVAKNTAIAAQLVAAEQTLAATIKTLQDEVAAGTVTQATMDRLTQAAAGVTSATQANQSAAQQLTDLANPPAPPAP